MYVILYLLAVVGANLIVAQFGPVAAVPVAFLCIGFDLTSRDGLHETWRDHGLLWKMSALIATGSLLSWGLNRNSGQVALASFIAFVAAATVDTVTYHLLKDKTYLVKVNGSNVVSALVDSMIFPTLAFGVLLPLVIIGQFLAKTAGGILWSLILRKQPKTPRGPLTASRTDGETG